MYEFEKESGKFFNLAQRYLDALLRVQRDAATRIILKAVEEGVDVKDIYLHVFEPCQHEIGRLWQTNQITVAQEHYCSAVTQMVMSQLYPYIFQGKKNGHQMVATCVAGEMHEIGIRMVADLFEMDGWDSYYLGANTPHESILDTIKSLNPEILAISASIHYNVMAAARLIDKIKESSSTNLKILVGGRPFLLAPDLWKKIGAHGFASNAQEAVKMANQLISGKEE
ncbi:MAG: cobalamin-dependent protein [Methanobacteriaceae archaeon]|nr:cobalamin-dependent protein [Methanobacteriaceae archaeon]